MTDHTSGLLDHTSTTRPPAPSSTSIQPTAQESELTISAELKKDSARVRAHARGTTTVVATSIVIALALILALVLALTGAGFGRERGHTTQDHTRTRAEEDARHRSA